MPSHFLWYERRLGQIITTYTVHGNHSRWLTRHTLLHLSAVVLPRQQQEAFRPPQHSDIPWQICLVRLIDRLPVNLLSYTAAVLAHQCRQLLPSAPANRWRMPGDFVLGAEPQPSDRERA